MVNNHRPHLISYPVLFSCVALPFAAASQVSIRHTHISNGLVGHLAEVASKSPSLMTLATRILIVDTFRRSSVVAYLSD